MPSVRLHVAADSVVWALFKCIVCGSVTSIPSRREWPSAIRCKKCDHMMAMTNAVIEAAKANSDERIARELERRGLKAA